MTSNEDFPSWVLAMPARVTEVRFSNVAGAHVRSTFLAAVAVMAILPERAEIPIETISGLNLKLFSAQHLHHAIAFCRSALRLIPATDSPLAAYNCSRTGIVNQALLRSRVWPIRRALP